MSEKKQEKLTGFLEGFTAKDIENSAALDIKPKLEIIGLTIDNAVEVQFLGEPYEVQLPIGKGMSKDDKIWMLDVMYKNTIHQFIAQANSFRYQLAVLVKKHFNGDMSKIVKRNFKIWKETAQIDKPEFKGKAIVYQVSLI